MNRSAVYCVHSRRLRVSFMEDMMKISLDEQLRELRRGKGNTQQELAEHLGITVQAISKWERGEGYPDIGLLPAISAYYDVTVDDLLGVDQIRRRKRIDEYTAKYKSLASPGEKLELARQAYRDLPNEPEIVHLLNCALYDDGMDKHQKEIAAFSEWLLKHANQSGQYFGAVRNLCYLYGAQGDLEMAKKYAAMGGRYAGTETQLLIHVLQGGEAAAMCKWNIEWLLHLIAVNVQVMLEKGNLEEQERMQATEFVCRLYELAGDQEQLEKWQKRMAALPE